VRYDVESFSYGMVFMPSFIEIGSGIQVILRLLSKKF
jgi:hypothetical protein